MVLCVRCLLAAETGRGQRYSDVDDFEDEATVVYAGESLCMAHFKTVRGQTTSQRPLVDYDT